MSNPIRNFGSRGTTMAIGCVAAIGGALAVMYGANRDVKKKEGNASLYQEHGRGLSGSDQKMTSSDVAAAVSIPKPGQERLQASRKEV